MSKVNQKTSRRDFLRGTTGAVAAFSIVPSFVLAGRGGTSPSDKLNIAHIGVGGRGRSNVKGTASENFVAMCDVDTTRAGETFAQYPNVKKYTDFRKMLDEVDNKIDAVTVSTPDHTHAVACMDAIRRGKHVYCEKTAGSFHLRDSRADEGRPRSTRS